MWRITLSINDNGSVYKFLSFGNFVLCPFCHVRKLLPLFVYRNLPSSFKKNVVKSSFTFVMGVKLSKTYFPFYINGEILIFFSKSLKHAFILDFLLLYSLCNVPDTDVLKILICYCIAEKAGHSPQGRRRYLKQQTCGSTKRCFRYYGPNM